MKDPKKKLDVLKGSFDSGIIEKEEYEKWKEKLEPEAKEFDKKTEDIDKTEAEEPKKSSEKVLIISVVVIILLLASLFVYSRFNKPEPLTLEDLHVLNLQGKLKPGQGYVYKGVYSFVTLDNVWYTQLQSPKGTKIYSLSLRYSPRELQDIVIEGNLDKEFFDNQTEFYVTFNPALKASDEYKYQVVAVGDFDTHMLKVFDKTPIAACDRNETDVCKDMPIITC